MVHKSIFDDFFGPVMGKRIKPFKFKSRHIDRGTHCECWSCHRKFKKGRKTCPYCGMPR